MTCALIGDYFFAMAFSVVTTSLTQEENLLKLNILDTQLSEIETLYQNYIEANPDGIGYTYSRKLSNNSTLTYDGQKFILHDSEDVDIPSFFLKRHKNCLNRNNGYKCRGCGGKFLNYSSAHNCDGKAVSCCSPQGPKGEDFGCVCYKRSKVQQLDIGSAGCCSSTELSRSTTDY